MLSYEDLDSSLGYDIIRLINKHSHNYNLWRIYSRLMRYSGGGLKRVSEALYEKLPKEDQRIFLEYFLTTKYYGNLDNNKQLRLDGALICDAIKDIQHTNSYEDILSFPREVVNDNLVAKISGSNFKLSIPVAYNTSVTDEYNKETIHVTAEHLLGHALCYYSQYDYSGNDEDFKLNKHDNVVFDCGSSIGDSMLYYHDKITKHNNTPEIHCFDLSEESISVAKNNIKLNDLNKNQIHFCKAALYSEDNIKMKANICSSSSHIVSNENINKDQSEYTTINTLTIDQYAESESITKVDVIKMDMEGVEREALKGARHTIKTYSPKLAICIYHVWDDPFVIPEIIHSISPKYKFSFKWASIVETGVEGILFCSPVKSESQCYFNPSEPVKQEEYIQALNNMLSTTFNVIDYLAKSQK